MGWIRIFFSFLIGMFGTWLVLELHERVSTDAAVAAAVVISSLFLYTIVLVADVLRR